MLHSQTKLFVTSEVPIYQIFSDDSEDTNHISDHMRGVMDDLVSSSVLLHITPDPNYGVGIVCGHCRCQFDVYWRGGNIRLCSLLFEISTDG